MVERFVGHARTLAGRAEVEAREGGSVTVEAEHLLLALARETCGRGGEVLRQAGLDHQALRDALDAEFERALRLVGVELAVLSSGHRDAPLPDRPRWAPSAKAALTRALDAARARGDRHVGTGHVLLGLLAPSEGTVHRALMGAGIEPAALVAATHAAMR